MVQVVMADIRDAWRAKSWDEMARENALAAIMTTPEMMASADMSQERLQAFFDRGRELYERYVKPLAPPEGMLVEYGCGAGRILRAVCDDGRACAGVDISPTMIELCRQFVPEAEAHVLQAGRSGLPDACASMVYSNAVVQHIQRLSDYVAAFDEMCRLLAPGGVLHVQVSTDDFLHGFDNPGRAENHETYSIHYPPGGQPYRRDQDNWNGVCIDHDALQQIVEARGLVFEGWRSYKAKPTRVIWLKARRP